MSLMQKTKSLEGEEFRELICPGGPGDAEADEKDETLGWEIWGCRSL